MPLDNPQGGIGYAPEFQSSALPWVTSSFAPSGAQEIDFNYVTRFITVVNLDGTNSLSIGFTANGIAGGNRVIVPKGVALTFEWRVSKLWIKSEGGASANYSLAVGLTTIPARNMPLLTGSAADGSNWAGVG